jgi:hypothetical protein
MAIPPIELDLPDKKVDRPAQGNMSPAREPASPKLMALSPKRDLKAGEGGGLARMVVGQYADAKIRVGDSYQATSLPDLRPPPPSGPIVRLTCQVLGVIYARVAPWQGRRPSLGCLRARCCGGRTN